MSLVLQTRTRDRRLEHADLSCLSRTWIELYFASPVCLLSVQALSKAVAQVGSIGLKRCHRATRLGKHSSCSTV